ncbi:hypothetical protein M3223_13440 [Paenibacillus pasadenensis]|uniref:hypothetical protein n=1 Tax=Paenibacillus pasadenensis TaxID=217090 RepID=UPI0020404273|nr:hypothetical protein [Paenibacillus pasadenensis]MCM3748354.1 hypothetical protein [Paenibacillus pasadenensis]
MKVAFICVKILLLYLLLDSIIGFLKIFTYDPLVYQSSIPSFKLLTIINLFSIPIMIVVEVVFLLRKINYSYYVKLYKWFIVYFSLCLVIFLFIFGWSFGALEREFFLLGVSIILLFLAKENEKRHIN